MIFNLHLVLVLKVRRAATAVKANVAHQMDTILKINLGESMCFFALGGPGGFGGGGGKGERGGAGVR